ncbi:hypothetical protein J437_LFUL003063 [Ladona fulva]|uniref:Apolipoprotein D n=1 Tax=Ladona fulva TaxID=123851 RepID=A0A8K0NYM0_LADFU|nr:hypothetical protein J437_LFUL003063 [Ladona fulva]
MDLSKMKVITSCFIALLCVYGALGIECPDVEVNDYFDVERYMGVWYEIAKYPNIFQLNGKCTAAQYTLADGKVIVNNTQIRNDKYENIVGSAVIAPDANGKAKLLVTFIVGGINVTAPYNVVATDYNGYSLVWSCEPFLGSIYENSWILARERTLREDQKIIVDAIIERNNLNRTRYIDTDQTGCE